jgi:sortase A
LQHPEWYSSEDDTTHPPSEGISLRVLKTASTFLERCLLAMGVLVLAVWFAVLLHGKISSHIALWHFEKAQSAAMQHGVLKSSETNREVDFSLWAPKRIQAYKNSLLNASDLPLAVIEVPRLHMRVPVFEGTDDLTLNRGVGRIEGTAMPGSDGNIGIAGHRDGFFRGLKDISVGDEVDLLTTKESSIYIVDQIEIVDPYNVKVLQPRKTPSLTLVTCYPFYFLGDAPNRYIVHASIAARRALAGRGPQPSTPSAGLGKKIKENSK